MAHKYGGPIWVGSPTDVRRGKPALTQLEQENDVKYWTDDDGIVKVDAERWLKAQCYEKSGWFDSWQDQTQDRIQEHRIGFDNYRLVPTDLGSVIEIGCGPFTQLIEIIKGRIAKTVTLLDPLLNSYLQHPNCTYKDGFPGYPTFSYNLMAENLNQIDVMFDVLICINVLEHVMDVKKVLHNICGSLLPGGLLIFGERSYDDFDVQTTYDIGHPIRVKKKVLDEFKSQFEPAFSNKDYFMGYKPERTGN